MDEYENKKLHCGQLWTSRSPFHSSTNHSTVELWNCGTVEKHLISLPYVYMMPVFASRTKTKSNGEQNSNRSDENPMQDENQKFRQNPAQIEEIIRSCVLQNQINECVELTCDNFHDIISNFPKSYMILFVTNQTTKRYLLPVFENIINKYFNR